MNRFNWGRRQPVLAKWKPVASWELGLGCSFIFVNGVTVVCTLGTAHHLLWLFLLIVIWTTHTLTCVCVIQLCSQYVTSTCIMDITARMNESLTFNMLVLTWCVNILCNISQRLVLLNRISATDFSADKREIKSEPGSSLNRGFIFRQLWRTIGHKRYFPVLMSSCAQWQSKF